MTMLFRKIVVYVPLTAADAVREAIGKAGAGQFGNYSFSSFSTKGIGRFLPGEGAHPAIGKAGKLESVEEERIEVACRADIIEDVLAAIRKTHPYEEPAIDVWPVEIR